VATEKWPLLAEVAPVPERRDMMGVTPWSPMSSGPRELPPGASVPGSDGRLDSWKEIAAYLRRSVRSARRWEKKEGLPVRRHAHGKGDSVYAFKADLDGWWNERGVSVGGRIESEEVELPSVEPAASDVEAGMEWTEHAGATTLPVPQRSRRAAWIGVGFALAFLVVGAVAWLSRNGSGPTARSLRPLPFQAGEWVLVAGFENRSGQPLFDGSLEYALARELSNSRYVNVVPRQRVGDALRLMRKPLDTRVDARLGREICLRDGDIRALITGRIERFGPKYLLSVELVDPSQGTSRASVAEEAVRDNDLLPAARRISDRVRVILGESPPLTRQGEGSLPKVTTPLLRPLQLYSEADTLIAAGNSAAAEELLKQAVDEDPEFASAHIHLAHAIRNQGRPKEEYLPSAETAFRLSEGTTERERYFIRGSYFDFLGQKDKAVAAYEALLSLYPDHFWATNNLIDFYLNSGRITEATRCAVRRAELRPKDFEARFWAAWFLAQFEPDLARASSYVRRVRDLDSPDVMREFPSQVAWLELFPANERWLEGDAAGALALVTRFAEELDSTPLLQQQGGVQLLGNIYLTLGQLRTAEGYFHSLADPTLELTGLSLLRGNRQELRRLSSVLVAHSYNVPLNIGIFLTRSGFIDQAGRVLAENEGKPVSALVAGTLEAARGELAMARNRTAEAIDQLRKSRESTRVFGRAPFLLGTETLASALVRQGDLEGAIRALELGSRQRHVAFHWVSNGALWESNQLLLARLYRKAGRAADAKKVESDLLKLLAVADADHPILLELRRLERS
jgi:tetratricopeptide (TPR) repeat protein